MRDGRGPIAIDGLEVRYEHGAPPAVAGLSLEVRRGEFHALLGPSGCGKTTLLKALAGLLQPSGGSISGFDGDDVAYVPQGNSCFPWLRVEENVAYGLWARGVSKRERLAKARGLLDVMGLGAQGRDYPATLSEGMRQRVAIARAFAMEVPVLLMDEPFSALDFQTKLRVQSELLGLWRGREVTVFYVTHDIDEALLLADRISVLTERPAAIRETLEVPFERPRDHSAIRLSPEYGPLYARCHRLLEPGSDAAVA